MDTARFVDRLSRHLGLRATRRTGLGSALAGLALGPLAHAAAQDATPAPGATPAAGEKPVFLFVQTAISGRGEANPNAGTPTAEGTPTPGGGAPFLLTLRGHSGQTIYFSDRPDRIVGAAPTDRFLAGLGFAAANPPNAALVGEFKAGQGVVVLTLVEPVYDAATDTLTYGADTLQGFEGENLAPVTREQVAARLPAEFGASALFIDDCRAVNACVRGTVDIGPIPGGPYPACWDASGTTCQPCDKENLDRLCNATYSECGGNCHADAFYYYIVK